MATYAVEVTRIHFLPHHLEIAYAFFMINSPKYDTLWAQKYTNIATRGGVALCYIASQKPEGCLGFVGNRSLPLVY